MSSFLKVPGHRKEKNMDKLQQGNESRAIGLKYRDFQ